MAVAEVGAEVAIDLPAEQQIDFAAEVGGVACAAGAEGRAVGGEEGVAVAFAPELVVFSAEADFLGPLVIVAEGGLCAAMEVDDVLAADDVDVAEVDVAGGEE